MSCKSGGTTHRLLTPVVAITVVLVAACHSPTGSAEVGGQYQLLSVNGHGIPCCTEIVQDTISAQLAMGFLQIGYNGPDDYTWTMTYTYHSADGAAHSVLVPFSSGSYSVRADTVIFVDDSMKLNGATGILVAPGRMVISVGHDTYTFDRLPI